MVRLKDHTGLVYEVEMDSIDEIDPFAGVPEVRLIDGTSIHLASPLEASGLQQMWEDWKRGVGKRHWFLVSGLRRDGGDLGPVTWVARHHTQNVSYVDLREMSSNGDIHLITSVSYLGYMTDDHFWGDEIRGK